MSFIPEIQNKISTTSFNSRAAATLAASAVFQGVGEDVTKYGRVGISIVSDNATDGVLTVEVSHDNSTWSGPTRSWANTSIATPHMWNIVEPYFRIKYTNGTTEATNLALTVQYSVNADVLLGHQIGEQLPDSSEAILTRDVTEFDLDASREHIEGQKASFFFGFNDSVGTGWEDIHPEGGDILWLTTASTVEVFSSDAADTSAGLGVRSVEIHGLSATGVEQHEEITMNGVTPVVSSLTYIRVNSMHSETCGTYGGSHQGDITVQVSSGGSHLSRMTGEEGSVDTSVQYGAGQSANGFYSVPLGKVMYLTRLEVITDISGTKNNDIILYERDNFLDITTPFCPRKTIWQESGIQASVEKEFKSHIRIKSLTDIWFRAKSSTGTSKIEASLDFYLVDEDSNGR